ncbi:MAG: hypothetical protein JST00_09190 [Deltaproteobacteria bacterium]|nr:hypothetical protein [Deltaproteobacteria bacterium]
MSLVSLRSSQVSPASLASFLAPYFRLPSVAAAAAVTFVIACSQAPEETQGAAPTTPASEEPSAGDPPRPPVDASGDATPDAGAKDATPDGPFDYCTAQAARYQGCFPGRPFSLTECKETEACLRKVYHPDVDLEGFLRCTTRTCSGGGMACLAFIDDHQNDPAFDAHLQACKDRRLECGDLGPLQFEDACSPFALMGVKDDLLALRATCLALPCDQIRACMEGKVREYCAQ